MAKDKLLILHNLSQFTGTEYYHKHQLLNITLYLTDGVLYLAKECECFWLIDVLASIQTIPKVKQEEFQVLTYDTAKGIVKVSDGNRNVIYRQQITSPTFPLDNIEIWFSNTPGQAVVYLPGEH
jgi:hypothetical protein